MNATLRFHSGMTTYQVRVDTSALAPASLLSKTTGTTAAGESAVAMEVENNANSGPTSPPKVIQGGVVPHTEVRNLPIGPLNLAVVNPEEKRKIIGDVFIRVAEETWQEMKLNPDEFLLCQGMFISFTNPYPCLVHIHITNRPCIACGSEDNTILSYTLNCF